MKTDSVLNGLDQAIRTKQSKKQLEVRLSQDEKEVPAKEQKETMTAST